MSFYRIGGSAGTITFYLGQARDPGMLGMGELDFRSHDEAIVNLEKIVSWAAWKVEAS